MQALLRRLVGGRRPGRDVPPPGGRPYARGARRARTRWCESCAREVTAAASPGPTSCRWRRRAAGQLARARRAARRGWRGRGAAAGEACPTRDGGVPARGRGGRRGGARRSRRRAAEGPSSAARASSSTGWSTRALCSAPRAASAAKCEEVCARARVNACSRAHARACAHTRSYSIAHSLTRTHTHTHAALEQDEADVGRARRCGWPCCGATRARATPPARWSYALGWSAAAAARVCRGTRVRLRDARGGPRGGGLVRGAGGAHGGRRCRARRGGVQRAARGARRGDGARGQRHPMAHALLPRALAVTDRLESEGVDRTRATAASSSSATLARATWPAPRRSWRRSRRTGRRTRTRTTRSWWMGAVDVQHAAAHAGAGARTRCARACARARAREHPQRRCARAHTLTHAHTCSHAYARTHTRDNVDSPHTVVSRCEAVIRRRLERGIPLDVYCVTIALDAPARAGGRRRTRRAGGRGRAGRGEDSRACTSCWTPRCAA